MGHLGVVLYEYLGEEYPEVLGSILGALKVSSMISSKQIYKQLCHKDNHHHQSTRSPFALVLCKS